MIEDVKFYKMRVYFTILLLCFFNTTFGCPEGCVRKFEKQFGKEQAKTLTQLINKFETYLSHKYQSKSNDRRYIQFLKDYTSQSTTTLTFDSSFAGQAAKILKNSGIEAQIFDQTSQGRYFASKKNTHESINSYPLFIQSLYAVKSCNSFMRNYVSAVMAQGQVSPNLVAKVALKFSEQNKFPDYFSKRILVVELFLNRIRKTF